jgi:hypothetical protein
MTTGCRSLLVTGLGHLCRPSGEIWHIRCDPFAHRVPILDMFSEDAPKPLSIKLAVPDSVRIDDQPRSGLANAQAGRLRAKHRHGKCARFFLQHLPQGIAFCWIAAVGSHAQKEVSFRVHDFLEWDFRLGREAVRLAHLKMASERGSQPASGVRMAGIVQLKTADTTSPVSVFETLRVLSLPPDFL